jgi:3-dehydroquinate dehydratase-2
MNGEMTDMHCSTLSQYLREGPKPSRLPHMRILVVNGPNLNLLGTREPSVYGTATLADLEVQWQRRAHSGGAHIEAFQSNHEGAIVDTINGAMSRFDGLVINAGALTHYSYSLRDAVAASGLSAVEVHISNIYKREEWRHFSVLSDVCDLTIVGRGTDGYLNAIDHLIAESARTPIVGSYSDHADASLDLRVPNGGGPHPVALLIHGGFWGDVWKRDLMDPMAVALVEHGWATVNIEYTRGLASYGSAIADVTDAVAWIKDNAASHQMDATRIVAVGHSAGGYLALQLAHLDAGISAAVPLAAVTNLAAISRSRPDDDPVATFLGSPQVDAPRLWEQAELAATPSVAVHLVHGADDDTVSPSQSEAYVQRLNAQPVVTIIDGGGHMSIIDPDAPSWPSVVGAIKAANS